MKKSIAFFIYFLVPSFCHSTITSILTPPAGNNGEVQFNNRQSFGADSDFSFSTSTNRLSVSSAAITFLQVSTISTSIGQFPYVRAEDYGAVGNDLNDDTTALQAALNTGKIVYLRQGATYYISSSLLPITRGGLIGDGTPTIVMSSVSFNNVLTDTVGRYGTNAVGIMVSGLTSSPFTPLTNTKLEGFRLQYQVTSSSRNVRGIVMRNAMNSDISNVEIFGFPMATGIVMASVSSNTYIFHCFIHDFLMSSTDFIGTPQSTAIEVDNDIINGVSSDGLRIENNSIRKIEFSAAAISSYTYQTDGINILRQSAKNISVIGNIIDTVGEGIDFYGSSSTIIGNTISNSYIFGTKLIHGAKGNKMSDNTIVNYGLGGIGAFGSSTAGEEVEGNYISGNKISNGDYLAAWAGSDSFGLKVGNESPAVVRNNTFEHNTLNPGTSSSYNIINIATTTTNIFLWNHQDISGKTAWNTGTIAVDDRAGQIIYNPTVSFSAGIFSSTITAKAGTSVSSTTMGGSLYQIMTSTSNTAATETTFYTNAITSNTLATNGDSFSFMAAGSFAATASTDKRIRVRFGGNLFFDSGNLAVTTASSWGLRGICLRIGSTDCKCTTWLQTSTSTVPGTVGYTTVTRTLANTNNITLTGSGTNSADVVAEFYKSRWDPAGINP